MTEQELAYELAKLINLSPSEKMDKMIELTFRNTICANSLAETVKSMKETLDSLPQKCLGQRLECEAKFSEIRQSDTGVNLLSISPKKMGAVAIAILLAILTAVGSAVASWLK
jgi:hypothetical protein